jgi:type IV pilus assembly protein PilB
MRITDELKELVLSGASATELKRQAMQDGMQTLRQAGIGKVKLGLTTVEEILRVTMAD